MGGEIRPEKAPRTGAELSPAPDDDADGELELPEVFLKRTLSRVGVLTRGQSHDLRRCNHEANALCRAFSAATWLTRLTGVVRARVRVERVGVESRGML
jgi:hypothetical protein